MVLAQDTQIICPEINECKEVTPALIKHIVIPFDTSSMSYHAFEFAVDLAKKYNAKLHVLTVMRSSALSSSFLQMPVHQRVIERDRIAKVELLFKMMSDVSKKFKVHLSTQMLFSSNVSDAIVSFCSQQKANLIVMGTRSRVGPKQFLVGSVAIDVLQKANCPVILVK